MSAQELIHLYSLLRNISIGIALLGLTLSIIVFFKLDIKNIYELRSGRRKRKQISEIRENAYKTDALTGAYVSNRTTANTNPKVENLATARTDPEKQVIYQQGLPTAKVKDDNDYRKSNNISFEGSAEKTTLLSEKSSPKNGLTGERLFKIIEDTVVIHTQETIQ